MEGLPPEIVEMRELAKGSLYFLCKAILGFKDFSPVTHKRMCNGAARALTAWNEKRGLRLIEAWPRSTFKTSCFSIGLPIFLYLNDNNIRVLLAGSTATNSSVRLQRIERVYTQNGLFRTLFPECAVNNTRGTKWNEEMALCPRSRDFLESTFECIGVGGRVTGRHYDVIIPDDLVDEACLGPDGLPSESMMNQAIQWHTYMDYLFDTPEKGIEIMACTRWAQNDIVGHIKKTDPRYEIHAHSIFGGCCEEHPDNTIIFPEKFTEAGLAESRRRDPYKFSLQMLNNPIDKDITDFNPAWFKFYQFNEKGQVIVEN